MRRAGGPPHPAQPREDPIRQPLLRFWYPAGRSNSGLKLLKRDLADLLTGSDRQVGCTGGALLAKVAERLARAVMQDMRWSAKARHDLAAVESLAAGVFVVVHRFRSDLGLFVHLHALVTDGAFEDRGGEVRFMPAATPTPERMTAVLAQVHKAVAAVVEDDDLDMDPALATCVQLGLGGPQRIR